MLRGEIRFQFLVEQFREIKQTGRSFGANIEFFPGALAAVAASSTGYKPRTSYMEYKPGCCFATNFAACKAPSA